MEQRMIPHSAPTLGVCEEEAALRVLRSGQLAQGTEVEAFEQECAAALGRQYAVAVNSGTSALHLALGALGVPAMGAVAVPSYACAALITAVRLHGSQPVLCDNGSDFNLDPALVPSDVEAVIVPHLFGAAAELPAGHTVIEDIAQSMGGDTGRGSPVAIASFYATKLMTTGEGGMLLTDDAGMAEYARDRRDYDNREEFTVRYNYKMTDLQAAIGRVQLTRLPEFLSRRRAIAAQYEEGLKGLPLVLPGSDGHVFFRYVVATDRREELEAHLQRCGVDAKRPVHRPVHHYLGGEFPGAERAHQTCLSLPIYPSLVDADVPCVIDSVRSFYAG
jgi:dTDP-4-amino-4,6-dideoxygalactose transaminase